MTNNDHLTEAIYGLILDCHEPLTLADCADGIVQCEIDLGCVFSDRDLILSWMDALDRACDSIIENYRLTEKETGNDCQEIIQYCCTA